MTYTAAAIVPAGGLGKRMGLSHPKQFHEIDGIPLLVYTIKAIEKVASIGCIILVIPALHKTEAEDIISRHQLRVDKIVEGGKLRQDSVLAGLKEVPGDVDIVLVHDGARPFVTPGIITSCLDKAAESGAAITAVPVRDTLKKVRGNIILHTVDREELWQAQTPQAARKELLTKACNLAARQRYYGTDEASLLERAGYSVSIVEGSEKNIKITRPEDLSIAETLCHAFRHDQPSGTSNMAFKIGHGYDAHQLTVNRDLVLGGVNIPHETGLLGHSDADVLTHALCDAILGALGLGDIGSHFPDEDKRYKDISSLILLQKVISLAAERNLKLQNADLTIIAEKPRLAPYIEKMRQNLAAACKASHQAINIKVTTTEKMGFTGREEGIAAHAVVLLQNI